MTDKAQIKEMEKELTVREAAAGHLTGIPKLQNQTAIDRLYDRLCHANLALIEATALRTGGIPETSIAESNS